MTEMATGLRRARPVNLSLTTAQLKTWSVGFARSSLAPECEQLAMRCRTMENLSGSSWPHQSVQEQECLHNYSDGSMTRLGLRNVADLLCVTANSYAFRMDPLIQPALDASEYRLRPFTLQDAGLVRQASLDPLIPLITTVPANAADEEIVDYIGRQHQRLVTHSGYSFAIADAKTDQAVGQIGLWLKNIDQGRGSVGYWVGAAHRNKGIVSSALDALSTWAIARRDIHRLELYVEPWNEGSWRAAERCGYTREGLLRSWQEVGGLRKDMYMYSRLK